MKRALVAGERADRHPRTELRRLYALGEQQPADPAAEKERFDAAIAAGFVEVSGNKVSVLTDAAETPDEINVEAARAELAAAEKDLAAAASEDVDSTAALRERYEAAETRLKVATGK